MAGWERRASDARLTSASTLFIYLFTGLYTRFSIYRPAENRLAIDMTRPAPNACPNNLADSNKEARRVIEERLREAWTNLEISYWKIFCEWRVQYTKIFWHEIAIHR